MKKQPKTNKSLLTHHKYIAIGSMVAIVLVALGGVATYRMMCLIKHSYTQASVEPIREMILQAATNINTDAPVDAKTGDIYFPQAKLYIPNPSSYLKLSYRYDTYEGASSPEFIVSNRSVFEITSARLYGARTVTELFDEVPKLQACQRGVRLTYNPLTSEKHELKQTVTLSNGKQLHMYTEKACPELSETVELLKDIRPY